MVQTDFAIIIVNGILILIIVILLFILFKTIREKKNPKPNETVSNDIDKIEPLEGSIESIKEITLSQPVILSSEENEKLKLEDTPIDKRDEKTLKKARTKRSSSKNFEKAEKLKERENPEKKPRKKPGNKVITKKKTQAIVNQNPVSG